ncbi:hypothetical protein [Aporhodopirellula aestuarii]|uniref:Uncharacterized protein n=1 Tax=Aporhodopirellula aestuarii TaxID=2950107 RepID=A0ABT0UFM5_9BACT|nr:hypothetical protein [Aporhodopirellula aestuarii]MCM2375023.1 hypothetical protein [Aporhodopirellula aestuarii]
MSQASDAIEFFRGPIDGHVEYFATTPKSFVIVASSVRIKRTSSWGLLFEALAFHDPVDPRIWAVYELVFRDGRFCYSYLSSKIQVGDDLDMDHVEMLNRIED